MAKTREIKGRMKAVANIRRITKTMQMIATARFQSALRRATSAKPYTQSIAALVGELAAAGQTIDHPLLRTPANRTGRQLVLVITSNRGLCGGYNANVLRKAAALFRESGDLSTDLHVVGKKGLAFFRFTGRDVSKFHSQFTDKPAYADVERLAVAYMRAFSLGEYDAVKVLYMGFISVARQAPRVLTLLPLQSPTDGQGPAGDQGPAPGHRAGGGSVLYDFSPEPEVLLGRLLPVSVKTQLYQCFNEAVVGEQVSRMVAMKAATDAATKMGRSLTRKYNRARQTAITTELSEIIGGASGLE